MMHIKKILHKTHILLFIILVVIPIAIGIYIIGYSPFFKTIDSEHNKYLFIYENDKNFESLCTFLEDSLNANYVQLFKLLADFRQYPENMKSGCYQIDKKISIYTLLNKLRIGNQTPVHVTFNNIRLISDLANRLSAQLMISADDIMKCLSNPDYCESIGFNTKTIGTIFIPNTYEVWWNISPDQLIKRMKREYDNFWTENRINKADLLHLTPVEISILASIVEEETSDMNEYPVVAGLYINRLHKGMLLQADPTVKYAIGDFSINRLLISHLSIDSPYNTYIHPGLPPGPIRIPSAAAIDAVLNATKHNFIYMCAKADFSGHHNFAVTLKEHNINAELYHRELNRRGIR